MNRLPKPDIHLLLVALLRNKTEPSALRSDPIQKDLDQQDRLARLRGVAALKGAFVSCIAEHWMITLVVTNPHEYAPVIDAGLAAAGFGLEESEIATVMPKRTDSLTVLRAPKGRPSYMAGLTHRQVVAGFKLRNN